MGYNIVKIEQLNKKLKKADNTAEDIRLSKNYREHGAHQRDRYDRKLIKRMENIEKPLDYLEKTLLPSKPKESLNTPAPASMSEIPSPPHPIGSEKTMSVEEMKTELSSLVQLLTELIQVFKQASESTQNIEEKEMWDTKIYEIETCLNNLTKSLSNINQPHPDVFLKGQTPNTILDAQRLITGLLKMQIPLSTSNNKPSSTQNPINNCSYRTT